MDGGLWHCTEDRDQDHPQEKEMQKSKMAVWGGHTNSCEKKRSERQREKDSGVSNFLQPPPGFSVHGIFQARTLKWVAISFSNSWKLKVKVKSLSRIWLFETPWTVTYQAPPSMEFSRQEYWSCHFLLRGCSWPGDWTWVSHIAGRSFTVWATSRS